ncbi:MAG: hypothetical protein H9535_08150 [Ignavibacteria bacterium]|nr:hypothetical protein [Ignavibacteria bacterium]
MKVNFEAGIAPNKTNSLIAFMKTMQHQKAALIFACPFGEDVSPIETIMGETVDSLSRLLISQHNDERKGFKAKGMLLQHENMLKSAIFKTFCCKEALKNKPVCGSIAVTNGFCIKR